jgi:F-type H+-transporting ATPase subunit k
MGTCTAKRDIGTIRHEEHINIKSLLHTHVIRVCGFRTSPGSEETAYASFLATKMYQLISREPVVGNTHLGFSWTRMDNGFNLALAPVPYVQYSSISIRYYDVRARRLFANGAGISGIVCSRHCQQPFLILSSPCHSMYSWLYSLGELFSHSRIYYLCSSVILGRAIKTEYLALGTIFGTGLLAYGASGGKKEDKQAGPSSGKSAVEKAKETVPINAGSRYDFLNSSSQFRAEVGMR